jgi:hypothetical protein
MGDVLSLGELLGGGYHAGIVNQLVDCDQ